MFCPGDAIAILMRNATSAGFAGAKDIRSSTYQRRAGERLRSSSVIFNTVESLLILNWDQKKVVFVEGCPTVMGK